MSILGNLLKWESGSVAGKASLFCSTKTTFLRSDSIIFQSHHADLYALNRYVSFPPLSFQTELIDLSTVDVILISNYHCMMALPYITEHTGFTGTVYATEPTVQIGRWEQFFISQEQVAEALLFISQEQVAKALLLSVVLWQEWLVSPPEQLTQRISMNRQLSK